MGSIDKRLERLEVRRPQRGSGGIPNHLNRYLEMLSGEEGASYGFEDAEDDRAILRKISDLRSEEGWPGNEGMLQVLEQDALDNLARYYAREGDR